MIYEGTLYRPPSEARSLIVQVTIGCSHNGCRFCTMYKTKQFRIRPLDEIKQDFLEAKERYGNQIAKIFLADGDALVLPANTLQELLLYIHDLFPYAKSITSYGTPKDILRHSVRDLSRLHEAGLTMVYMGAESGDAKILKQINKGVSREKIIAAGQKLKEAHIQSSITLISGLGGKEYLQEHALESAELISQIKPDYLGFLTLMLEPGAPILQDIKEEKLHLLEPDDIIMEMELFLKHVDTEKTIFRANHASNYMTLKGTLNQDIPALLKQLEITKKRGAFRHEDWRRL
ncbi:MAG TPA: radical SAM protein [Ruminococcaceae bacterium]|nr:radical SAM protein [Oscillospiraceae bacterium]